MKDASVAAETECKEAVQIVVPLTSLEAYILQGWAQVGEPFGGMVTVRKELPKCSCK